MDAEEEANLMNSIKIILYLSLHVCQMKLVSRTRIFVGFLTTNKAQKFLLAKYNKKDEVMNKLV